MKKIAVSFLLVIVLSIFNFFVVQAEEDINQSYVTEGENYTNTNWTNSDGSLIMSNSSLSNEKYVCLSVNPAQDTEYYIEYNVTVPEAGYYNMEIVSTPPDETTWASPIFASVNNGDNYHLSSVKTDSVLNASNFAKYSADAVYLNMGTNTVKFFVKDRIPNGKYLCLIDYFTFSKTQVDLIGIYSDRPMMVFESGSNINVYVQANGFVPDDVTVDYTLCDYRGNSVLAGSTVIASGTRKGNINLGILPKGNYTICTNYNDVVLKNNISVVVAEDERAEYTSTPFALDTNFYGVYSKYSNNRKILVDYAKSLNLLGISWIRDRIELNDTIAQKSDEGISVNSNRNIDIGSIVSANSDIKISTVVNSLPQWSKYGYSSKLDSNLVEVYDLFKSLGDSVGNNIDCLEILNETDFGGFVTSDDGPDLYAAFLKAATIGMYDSNSDAFISTQGSARAPESRGKYIKMLYENDLMKYSSVDNYHYHQKVSGVNKDYYEFTGKVGIDSTEELQEKFSVDVPIWITESGLLIEKEEAVDLSVNEQYAQSKYIVTSTVESLAAGTDKHFYFLGSVFQGTDYTTGIMNKNTRFPAFYPAYSSLAAMTYVLGEGIYVGKLNHSAINGYIFEDHESKVLVLYSDESKNITISLSDNDIEKYDMFANCTVISSNDGNYLIEVGSEPIYIKYQGELYNDVITTENILHSDPVQKTFSISDRVIIQQQYSEASRVGARHGGYYVDEDNCTVNVIVTNLNTETVTGTITGYSSNDWRIKDSERAVTILPFTSQTLSYEIENYDSSDESILYFTGNFDGNLTSKSSAYVNSGYSLYDDYTKSHWIASAKYSEKKGLYTKEINTVSYDQTVMRLFTYDSQNATLDNELTYNFGISAEDAYDIWVLTTRAGVPWMTDWRYSVDSDDFANHYVSENGYVADVYSVLGQSLYWYKIKAYRQLTEGNHKFKIRGDLLRDSTPQYLFHIIDSIVVVPSKYMWNPSKDINESIVTYEKLKMINEMDFSLLSGNVQLPSSTETGASISWTSSDESVISNSGIIYRTNEKQYATLTATIRYRTYTSSLPFKVSVLPILHSDVLAEIIFADADNNEISVYDNNINSYVDISIVNNTDDILDVNVSIEAYMADSTKLGATQSSFNVQNNSRVKNRYLISNEYANSAYLYKVNVYDDESQNILSRVFYSKMEFLNAPYIKISTVTIYGKTQLPHENIAVVITKDENYVTDSMTLEQLKQQICYLNEITSDESGYFTLSFNMDTVEDSYTCRISTVDESGSISLINE
ncbi:MAG: hypothetical protein J6D26_00600 [Clostridia bacterium]|nr:hypothetical protein [Clostridia bacterium]